jgi:predicted metal-dependent HD superfamily phosphohydrolase
MAPPPRWTALWGRLGAHGDAAAAYAELAARYAEPHRRYHTLDHVLRCLDALDPVRALASAPDAVEFALWYHDAVYDPRGGDNEALSADLAIETASDAALPAAFGSRVSALILATRHESVPGDPDAGLVVDADLAVLGGSADEYAAYERKIRAEYAWVPDPVFRIGRAAVLRRFLERPAIYTTEPFRREHETRARANLEAELGRLKAGA